MRYLVSIIKTTFKMRNSGILIFMVLNSALLFEFCVSLFEIHFSQMGFAIVGFCMFTMIYYAVILGLGTLIIRLLFDGNRIIMGNSAGQVSLAFAEAYEIAKRNDPDLSDNIKLYACTMNYPAAYAFGRDTILMSEPAAELSHVQLRTMFLEKFAQLSNHDSERMLFLIAGNAIFVGTICCVKVMVYIAIAIVGIVISVTRIALSIITGHLGHGSGFLALSAYFNICRVLSNAIEAVLLFLLNLTIRLALLSARSNYYVNDQFVCECGYSSDLRYYLQYVEPDISGFQSTLATITAAKPSRFARLSRIEESSTQGPAHNNLMDLFGTQQEQETQSRLERESSTSFRVVSRTGSETENNNTARSGFRTVSRNDRSE